MNGKPVALSLCVGTLAIVAFVWLQGRHEGGSYLFLECFSKSRGDRSGTPTDDRSWGVLLAEGSTKSVSSVPAVGSNERAGRPLDDAPGVEVSTPLVVYRDAGVPSSFVPSGWMGDLDSIDLETACTTRPHSGKTCIRITYKPGGFSSKGWSGIYWQHPADNWGELPGYRLSRATRLTFHARADGRALAEFKIGGINCRPHHNSSCPYRDSFGPLSTGVVRLSREWRMFTIPLRSVDTPIHLIGGFCWVSSKLQNPRGATVFLDDIVME